MQTAGRECGNSKDLKERSETGWKSGQDIGVETKNGIEIKTVLKRLRNA